MGKHLAAACALGAMVFGLSSCAVFSKSGKTPASMPGQWQAAPIVVDGDSKDWPSPYPNYDAKAMVAYATSNDDKNLYITMQSGDELTQMKILKQGLVVSIDTTGRKEGQLHINFPMPSDNDIIEVARQEEGMNRSMGMPRGKKLEQKLATAAKNANQLSLEGFEGCSGGYATTQTNACGIKVVMRMDEYKELVWEAVVPLKAIYHKETITAADAGRPISVCFAVKAFKQTAVKNGDNSGPSMANTMGGGTGMNSAMRNGGGINRGGGRPVADNPMQHLYESTKTWKQFGLAWK